MRKKDFEWRYQPPFDSDKARMLTYIQNQDLHPSQDKTAMILTALTAYYMPLALYSEGSYSDERLELILLDSVSAFANQLKYTCAALNVKPTRVSSLLCNAFPVPLTSDSLPPKSKGPDKELDVVGLDNLDPQIWDLAGMTTDSETF